VVTPSGTVCRTGSGDSCDLDETCTGTAGQACPADDAPGNAGVVCRTGSGDLCDPDETCTGTPGATCPPDVVSSAGTVCRPAAGDCDVEEQCDGTVGDACPPDVFVSAGTVCRAVTTGDVCDEEEVCDGSSAACPPDAVKPAGTECRASSGECDPAEDCDGSSKQCPPDTFSPDGTSCTDDGMFCTGVETCQSGACTGSGDPCGGAYCDEIEGICLSGGCPSGPLACRSATKSIFLVKNKTPDSKDKLIWKWIKGESTDQTEFGDPTTSADYSLCVYAGTTASLVAELDVMPDGTLWKPIGTKGYKFKDNTLTEYGVQKVILKGSDQNKSKALVKGKGDNLPDLPPASDPMLALDLPVKVQLINQSNGICFEGVYDTPDIKKNEPALFKAKAQ